MKMQATKRKEDSRKSAEWIGFRATTTAIAIPSASTAKITNSQPAAPVRSAPGTACAPVISSLLDDRERLDVLRRSPVGQLADVQIERVVPVVRRHLVRLRGQPDRLGIGRAGLFAQLAEHAALQVDVETVQDLDRLALRVLLVVPVDVDDVDRALDRAERALDAALFVESEHPAEPVGRELLLLGILDRDLLLEEVTARDGESVEQVEQGQPVEPPLQGHPITPPRTPESPPAARGGRASGAASPGGTSRRTGRQRYTRERTSRCCGRGSRGSRTPRSRCSRARSGSATSNRAPSAGRTGTAGRSSGTRCTRTGTIPP